MKSASHVRIALDEKIELEQRLAEIMESPEIVALELDIANLDKAAKGYVLDHYGAGEGYEDDVWKATKVVGHRRSWNVDTLEKIMPRALFKRCTTIAVDSGKLDQLVREKKVDRKKIAKAFTEVANEPYIRITRKTPDQSEIAADEAAGLAEKLA